MNLIKELKSTEKGVFTQNMLRANATITLLQIKKDAVLKEHQSMTNAMLVLISGNVSYDEANRRESLSEKMDYLHIPEHVTHKVTGLEDSVLLLIQ